MRDPSSGSLCHSSRFIVAARTWGKYAQSLETVETSVKYPIDFLANSAFKRSLSSKDIALTHPIFVCRGCIRSIRSISATNLPLHSSLQDHQKSMTNPETFLTSRSNMLTPATATSPLLPALAARPHSSPRHDQHPHSPQARASLHTTSSNQPCSPATSPSTSSPASSA